MATIIKERELTAARELRAVMQGTVVLRDSDDYARARQIWNRAVENQPALLAVCETSADVQAAVRAGRRHDLSLSARGGGHDWTGRALCSDGLVIDLGRMRQVTVDPHGQVAIVSGWGKAQGRSRRRWRPRPGCGAGQLRYGRHGRPDYGWRLWPA